ncbi:MAG: beta-glucosidase [Bifidobacteriaceae bacterium]|jgi:beta-N-acetylhexosaminidase|nr:beta-glucosidase [Bifidobacteriaceae bacterium]
MSLEQKAAQLVMVPLLSGTPTTDAVAAVRDRGVGGVLLLGTGWTSASQVAAVTTELTAAAAAQEIKPWLAADQEGGRVQRLKGEGFATIPPAVEQGAMTADALTSQAAVWGGQLRTNGINLDFAPVADSVDLANRGANAPIGALDRDFGLDPAGNGAHAAAVVTGLNEAGVGSAVKHFPGLGFVTGNTDFTAEGIRDSVTSPQSDSLEAFRLALAAQPTMVLMSLATYTQIDPDAPAAYSPKVVTDLLRNQLGWTGVVTSDSLTATAVAQVPVTERITRFVTAGGDLAVMGDLTTGLAALDGLVAAAKDSPDLAKLVDEAAVRVLAAKIEAGLA